MNSSVSPKHGGGERLAAAGACLVRLRAQTLREAGDAVVGVARREHVLGHAQVGVEDAARELRRVPDVRELVPGMLLPAAVHVGEHASQDGEVARIGSDAVRLGGHSARALPIARVPGHHAAQQGRLTEVFGPLGLEPLERGLGARDVARREARARLLHSQRGHALRGRDLDRLGIGAGSAGLAGPVE